jgi:hypothetical protein
MGVFLHPRYVYWASGVNDRHSQCDAELTEQEHRLAERFSKAELADIDNALVAHTCGSWRKVARVVGTTMLELPTREPGIPDVFYAHRIRQLVAQGLLEAQGDLSRMRASEVRRPPETDET